MGYIADLLFSFFRCSQICLLVFYYLQCESWYLWCFASETERYYLDIRQLPLTTSLKKTKFVVSWLRNGMNCAIHILHSTELKNEGVTCVVVQSLSLVHLLQPHGLQPARLHCFSLSPRVCSNSCPVESVMLTNHLILCALFSFCLQSFPASGSFQMNWFFTSGSQNIEASVSASVLPLNFHGWFPLGLTGLISLQSSGLQVSTPAPQFKSINSLALSLLYGPNLTSVHDYWKNHSFDYMGFVGTVMSLLFNPLSRFVIAFFPRSKCL